MQTLFSIAFTGIFLAFIVAAIVGHVLLIKAFLRPSSDESTSPSRLPNPSLQPGF